MSFAFLEKKEWSALEDDFRTFLVTSRNAEFIRGKLIPGPF